MKSSLVNCFGWDSCGQSADSCGKAISEMLIAIGQALLTG